MTHSWAVMKPGWIISIHYAETFPAIVTNRNNAWAAFLATQDDDDNPKARDRWKRKGFRLCRVTITVAFADGVQAPAITNVTS